MIIDKVLNNNVVLIKGQRGDEQVVMGRGLAFKKRSGDPIDPKQVEKIFSLKNNDVTSRLSELLSEIPLEVMTTSEKIISHAINELSCQLHDSIHISLTDHINFALQRHQQGINIKNGLLWEIKKLYPKEFAVGKTALDIINQRLNIQLPEDEAGFITLHIVNAQLNDDMSNTIQLTHIMQEILHIIKYHFKIEFNEEALSYDRLITHLKFFAQRVINHHYLKNSDDEELVEIFMQKYPQAYHCTKKIDQFLQKTYQYPLSRDEVLFLTIHIERIRKDCENKLFLPD